VDGTLHVTPASLLVTAENKTRAYGATNPVFTAQYSGFVNNETNNVIAGQPSLTTEAAANTPAGVYVIVAQQGSLKAANYQFDFTNGNLTITAALALSANPLNYVIGNGAVLIDTNAAVQDGGTIDFAGATLTVTINTNAAALDGLFVDSPSGQSAGLVVDDNAISWNDATVGSVFVQSNALTMTFGTNAAVSSAMLTELIRQIAFGGDDGNTAPRNIHVTLDYASNHLSGDRLALFDHRPAALDLDILAAKTVLLRLPVTQVLSNATDVDGDALALVSVHASSTNGAAAACDALYITYAPTANSIGDKDSISYTVSDGRGGEATGEIHLSFIPFNWIGVSKAAGTNRLQMVMGGDPSRVYLIQTSPDLVSWTPFQTVTSTPTGIISILDTVSKIDPHRFYRAVAQ